MTEVSLEFVASQAAGEMASGLVTNLPKVLNNVRELRTDSLVEHTKMTRVEPIVLFDETIRLQPYVPDIMEALVNIFSGYYLQAIAVSVNVGNVEVRKLLSKLDPNRVRDPLHMVGDVSDLLSMKYIEGINNIIAEEEMSDELRRRREEERRAREDLRREREDERRSREERRREREHVERDTDRRLERERKAREDIRREREEERKRREDERRSREERRREMEHVERDTDRRLERERKAREDIKRDREEMRRSKEHELRTKEYQTRKDEMEERKKREMEELAERGRFTGGVSRGSIDDFNTSANLSTGKMINVEIESGGRKANIPVNVRLITKLVAPEALVSFLTVIRSTRTATSRIKRWRSGELSFFRDLVLCQDIIDEEKRAHYSDKGGTFRNLRNKMRSKENNALDIITDNINVATASSIIVMSKDTATKVELALLGKLDNFNTRETLFKVTFTMILVIVDIKWDKIIMYHKSISEPSILSVRDFKNKSSSSGPDINEILMAYRAGTAPSF